MKEFITSIRDLRRHVSLHRRRVHQLGWALKSMTRSRFILFLVLYIHDIEKYLFLPWLWKHYGKKPKSRKLYDRMNRCGMVIQDIVLLPFILQQDAIAEVLRIEHIADVVDRNTDPVAMEEFNLTVQKPMSDFLPGEDIPIAETLKKLWPSLTSRLQYKSNTFNTLF